MGGDDELGIVVRQLVHFRQRGKLALQRKRGFRLVISRCAPEQGRMMPGLGHRAAAIGLAIPPGLRLS